MFERKTAALLARAWFAFAVVISPELFGGVFAWSSLVIALLWLISLLLVGLLWRKRTPNTLCITSIALFGITLWTALQAAPLPCAFVERIAPQSVAQLHAALSNVYRGGTHWCTISRDSGNTELELIKGIGILSAFFASWFLVVSGQRTFVLRCIAASVTFLAFVSICHQLASAESVFGLYSPRYAAIPVYGPLMNPNNMAGFFVLGFPIVAVLGVKSSGEKRLLWFAFSALVGGALFLSLSRGGIAAFIGTSVFFTILVSFRKRGGNYRYGRTLFAAGAGASGLALGAYVAFEIFWAEVRQGDISKLALVSKFISVILNQPLVGIGKGAFTSVGAQYQGTTLRYEYSENVFIDWAAEWGIPVTALFLLVIGAVIFQRLTNARSLSRQAAIVGLLGIAAQNFVDFSLELSGIAVVASVILAIAVAPLGNQGERRERRFGKWLFVRPLSSYVVVSGFALLGITGPRVLNTNVVSIQAELERTIMNGDHKQFRSALKRGILAHPSEPNFAWLAATDAFRNRDPATLKWLNRTMSLAPHWPGPHEMAARWLFSRGLRQQAFLEIRETELRERGRAHGLMCQALGGEKDLSNLLRAAPAAVEARVTFLEDAASCLDFRSQLCQNLDQVLLALKPNLAKPRIRKAQLLLEEGKKAAALAVFRKVAYEFPKDTDIQVTFVEAILRAGNTKEAVGVLRKVEKRVIDKRRLVEIRARAETDLGNVTGMRKATEELLVLAGGDTGGVAQALALRGHLEERLGNIGHALRALEESHRIFPDRGSLIAIRNLAGRMGDRMRVFSAVSQLCSQYPDSDSFCKERDSMLEPVISQ